MGPQHGGSAGPTLPGARGAVQVGAALGAGRAGLTHALLAGEAGKTESESQPESQPEAEPASERDTVEQERGHTA